MNKKTRSAKFTAKQSARLGAYLATSLGASTVATSTADAAIVNINIGPSGFNIGGINAGVGSGDYIARPDFPFIGAGTLEIYNNSYGYTGLDPDGGLFFAVTSFSYASPRNFALNDPINSGASFAELADKTVFRYDNGTIYNSPNFFPSGFMGFRTGTGNYGWLQVRWQQELDEFEILGGAYEDQAGVAILAGQGAGPAAVPEPGTWAAAALLAGGAAFVRWRKRRLSETSAGQV